MKVLGTLCLAGLLTVSASANTLFDNTTQSITGQDGVGATGSDGNGNANIGPILESFQSSAGAWGSTLTDVQVSLFANDNTDLGSVTVGLYADLGGSPGGLIANLGSIADNTLNNCASVGGICTGAPTLSDLSGLSETLATSTQYWIGISGTDGQLWNYEAADAGTGVAGNYFYSQNGLHGVADGAYLMSVSATDNPQPTSGTPEPATFVLLGSSVLGLGLFRRKIKG